MPLIFPPIVFAFQLYKLEPLYFAQTMCNGFGHSVSGQDHYLGEKLHRSNPGVYIVRGTLTYPPLARAVLRGNEERKALNELVSTLTLSFMPLASEDEAWKNVIKLGRCDKTFDVTKSCALGRKFTFFVTSRVY